MSELTPLSDPDNVQFEVVEDDGENGDEGGLTPDEVRRVLDGESFSSDGLTAALNVDSDGEVHTGAMIALIPTAADAERLALETGEPVDQLHLTLAYLGEAADFTDEARVTIIESAWDVADALEPITAEAFAVNVFNAMRDDIETALVLGVSGEGLKEIYDGVWHELNFASFEGDLAENHSPWVPHVTLAYTEDLDDAIEEAFDRTGPITFDTLRVAFGNDVFDLPLGGELVDDDVDPDAFTASGEALQGAMPGKLKTYWTKGEGAAKIRWGTGGDFTRCTRQLRRYFPRNVEGLCANLHHAATGKWPGERRGDSEGDLMTAVVEAAETDGCATCGDAESTPEDAATELTGKTAPWQGILTVEGTETGDGRFFAEGSLTWADPPLPLRWQKVGHHGGDTDVTVDVGRIDEIWRDGKNIMGKGVFDLGQPDGREAYRRVTEKFLRGNSVDVDSIKHAEIELIYADDADEYARPELTIFHKGRIRGSTLVQIPAFVEAQISVEAPVSDETITASVTIAETAPPLEWFVEPGLDGPTPLTITEDGRIYGHAALWNTCHTSFKDSCVVPPREGQHKYFRLGEVVCDDNSRVAVGHITLGTGHAPVYGIDARSAQEHYDHTGSVVADVASGEDAHGIWVAGSLRSNITPERLQQLRSAQLSGDWRSFEGRLRLVALLAVNVPGFPVPRLRAYESNGERLSMVAAGVPHVGPTGVDDESSAVRRLAANLARRAGLDLETRREELMMKMRGGE